MYKDDDKVNEFALIFLHDDSRTNEISFAFAIAQRLTNIWHLKLCHLMHLLYFFVQAKSMCVKDLGILQILQYKHEWTAMMDNSDTDSDDKSCIVVPLSPENPKIHRRIGHVVVKYKNFIVVWGGYEVSEYYLISFEVEKGENGHFCAKNILFLLEALSNLLVLICSVNLIPSCSFIQWGV